MPSLSLPASHRLADAQELLPKDDLNRVWVLRKVAHSPHAASLKCGASLGEGFYAGVARPAILTTVDRSVVPVMGSGRSVC